MGLARGRYGMPAAELKLDWTFAVATKLKRKLVRLISYIFMYVSHEYSKCFIYASVHQYIYIYINIFIYIYIYIRTTHACAATYGWAEDIWLYYGLEGKRIMHTQICTIRVCQGPVCQQRTCIVCKYMYTALLYAVVQLAWLCPISAWIWQASSAWKARNAWTNDYTPYAEQKHCAKRIKQQLTAYVHTFHACMLMCHLCVVIVHPLPLGQGTDNLPEH
jgi:hypothetical protein